MSDERDIVERLLTSDPVRCESTLCDILKDEAAAEITRLRTENAALHERCMVLREECEAWREAWDGMHRKNKGYVDPFHCHRVPQVWDDTGLPCESCIRFDRVRRARVTTDAANAITEES